MREKLGICQWFHYQDFERTLVIRDLLRELSVRHLRMDISWADYHREGGRQWYAWLFQTLGEFQLLPCVWHTPPSLSLNGKSNGPPKDVRLFPAFLWEIIQQHGHRFEHIELWNEPNNWIKWDRKCDPAWRTFAEMIAHGAGTANLYEKKAVLGGISPLDGRWFDGLQYQQPGVLANIDVIGIHAFPDQWNDLNWEGWAGVFAHLRQHIGSRKIWITETGCSAATVPQEYKQEERLYQAACQTRQAERVYWYTLLDLPDTYDEIEVTIGGYKEPLERSLGLVANDGRKKRAFAAFKKLMNNEHTKAAV